MRDRALTPFLFWACLLLPASAAGAGIAPPRAPADGLKAGALVTTAVPGLPGGAREFELVLLPESGPPIQVTPELPAGVREVTWRVPRTFARRVRLAVRCGGAHDERQSPPSEPFELAPLTGAELARLVAGAADRITWDARSTPPPGWTTAGGRDVLAQADPLSREAEPVSSPDLALPAADRPCDLEDDTLHDRPLAHRTSSRQSVFTPLRN
jgi:hypothetical protein